MATTNFTTSLKLALPTTGDLVGTWGDAINNSITTLLDTAVAGNFPKDVTSADWTLTSNNGATDEARYAVLIPYGTTGVTRYINAPKVSKTYIIINKTNASVIIRGGPTTPTTGVTVAAGATAIVAWDSNLATPDFVAITPASISGVVPVANGGTGASSAATARTNLGATTVGGNVYTLTNPSAITFPRFNADNTVSALDAASFRTAIGAGSGTGSVTSVSGTGTVSGLTLSGTVTSSGSLTLGGSITGFLPTAGGTMTGAITFAAGQTVDGTNGVGYINIPQNSQSAAYTLVAADAGKHIFHPSTDANARTFTIPANSSVAYPIGTAISFVNMTSQVVSIAITTDTMYLAGTGTTGTRSLAQYGTATALKMTSTTWIISGAGLT